MIKLQGIKIKMSIRPTYKYLEISVLFVIFLALIAVRPSMEKMFQKI